MLYRGDIIGATSTEEILMKSFKFADYYYYYYFTTRK